MRQEESEEAKRGSKRRTGARQERAFQRMRGVRRTRLVEKGKANGGKGEHGEMAGFGGKGSMKMTKSEEDMSRRQMRRTSGSSGA